MEGLESGALITCNHFNPFDSFAVEEAFRNAKLNKKQKLFIVLEREIILIFLDFMDFCLEIVIHYHLAQIKEQW